MPIIRLKLDPNTVYPTNIRYNEDTDTVQSLINGEWVDNPEADPRHQTTYPPRLTADPACDAAQSVTDALKAQIDGILTAIEGASTTFTIAGLILGLFTFGVFEIFIAIALAVANTMIDAGAAAINAALTDPVYHTLACILDCHMDSSGRLSEAELAAVEADVNAQIGGLGAIILNSMLSLAGEGGINNLASLGMSNGDCEDCGCTECASDFVIWDRTSIGYPADFSGTIVAQSGGSIRVQFNTNYVHLTTNNSALCCYVANWNVVEGGAVYGTARALCGTTVGVSDAPPPGDPFNQCVTFMELQSLGADRPLVDIFFASC